MLITIQCTNCGHDIGISGAKIPPFPVPELLNTNHIPSPFQSHQIKTVISDILPNLFRLATEYEQVHAASENLKRDRGALADYVHTHIGLLSSIRKLPPEILSVIFQNALPNFSNKAAIPYWRGNENLYRRAVMLPGQICTRWRNIIYSNPQLWSSITTSSNSGDNDDELDLIMTKAWLARSSACPLAVHIIRKKSQSIHPISLIFDQSHRWKHVVFDCGMARFIKGHGVTCNTPLLQLESLRVESVKDDRLLTLGDLFLDAPKLHILELEGNFHIRNLRMPMSQLSELCIQAERRFNSDQFFEILQKIPGLVSLKLSVWSGLSETLPRNPIHHHSLQTFKIQGSDPSHLLDYIKIPSLRTFCCEDISTWTQTSFTSFLTRSSCSLQKLVFHSCRMSDVEVIHCLQHTPDLLELDLVNSIASTCEMLIESLERRSSHNDHELYLVPKLRRLKLTTPRKFPFSAFADMIQSRLESNTTDRLTVVERIISVELCHDMKLKSRLDERAVSGITRLFAMKETGLDIRTMDAGSQEITWTSFLGEFC